MRATGHFRGLLWICYWGKKRYSLNECRALWRPASMQHISTTKASLWCSWCPVPQTEINQIAVLLILTNSHEKLLCLRDVLCCFYWKNGTEFSLISSSYQVTAHRKRGNMLTKSGAMWDTVHGTTFIQQFQWNKPNSAWICCAARVEIHFNCKMLFWGTYLFFFSFVLCVAQCFLQFILFILNSHTTPATSSSNSVHIHPRGKYFSLAVSLNTICTVVFPWLYDSVDSHWVSSPVPSDVPVCWGVSPPTLLWRYTHLLPPEEQNAADTLLSISSPSGCSVLNSPWSVEILTTAEF